jgi:hypothetical protein
MILSGPGLVTPERLTGILRAGGAIDRARVTDLVHEPIGIGLLGDTFRFTIGYDRDEPGAPATIAGKFSAADPVARANAAAIDVYRIEANFYREIAGQVHVRRPACHYAEISEDGSESGLLLEDMGPARPGDQLNGCSRAEAERVLAEAAALHAPRFGDPALRDIAWLNIRYGLYPGICASLGDYVRIFRERYEAMLDPDDAALAERFAGVAAAFATTPGPRPSLIHGDFRLDNMLFDAKGGEVPVVILDWQSIGVANPGIDVAYFLGTSYPIEDRARDEADLLRFYHDRLRAFGVKDYSWDDLWFDYRRGAWLALITAIFASAVAKRTDRGDRMFMRMYRGGAAQMLAHDTLALA